MTASVLMTDIKDLILDSTRLSPVPLICVVIWIILVSTSLKGVDRRDELAHLTYVTVLVASGALLYILAQGIRSREISPTAMLTVSAAAAVIAGLRWDLQRRSSAMQFTASNSAGKPSDRDT
jgi:hypothetical protein